MVYLKRTGVLYLQLYLFSPESLAATYSSTLKAAAKDGEETSLPFSNRSCLKRNTKASAAGMRKGPIIRPQSELLYTLDKQL